MRKTHLFAAFLATVLLIGALTPQADAQRWHRWSYGSYYAPSYYYSAPAYGYSTYWTTPAYAYSYPAYSYPAYSNRAYSYPAYSYPAYGYSTYYWNGPTYYSGYSTPYYRGYVYTPWVQVGW